MSNFYERGCVCPEEPCPYHPTPNRQIAPTPLPDDPEQALSAEQFWVRECGNEIRPSLAATRFAQLYGNYMHSLGFQSGIEEGRKRGRDLRRTLGIVELAVENQSVFDYIQHWEGRTEAAEKKVAELQKLIQSVQAELLWHRMKEIRPGNL